MKPGTHCSPIDNGTRDRRVERLGPDALFVLLVRQYILSSAVDPGPSSEQLLQGLNCGLNANVLSNRLCVHHMLPFCARFVVYIKNCVRSCGSILSAPQNPGF